ncbi:serine O-acetyltransferase, partial [Pseudidiomarina aestuarii]
QAVNQLGGNVCDEIPEVEMDDVDFIHAEKEAAKRRRQPDQK